MKALLDDLIPEFSVRLGGTTSIDVTKPGIDKAYGIRKLREVLGIGIADMIFIGDAIFPGGNDFAAEEAGVASIGVKGPGETQLVIKTIPRSSGPRSGRRHPGEGDMTAGFRIRRLRWIMKPEPGDPIEVEGVLNPAAVRGLDGQLYLFPRLVARATTRASGWPGFGSTMPVTRAGSSGWGRLSSPWRTTSAARRVGVGARNADNLRRATPAIRHDVYRPVTRGSSDRPRGFGGSVPLAPSGFGKVRTVRRDRVRGSGQQGCECLPDRDTQPVRTTGTRHPPSAAVPRDETQEIAGYPAKREVRLRHESIWISYCPTALPDLDSDDPVRFTSHHRLAAPKAAWERVKIGSGTPPVMTPLGWLIVYHGVSAVPGPTHGAPLLRYAAGVMVLAKEHPRMIRYRSAEPLLTPTIPQELSGTVADVVFPTGIDRRDDLGTPNRFDVYYGMADSSIGVARLDVPSALPASVR